MTRALFAFAASAALTAPTSASVLYDKQPDGSGLGYVSQDFLDFPDFSTYTFDDFWIWPRISLVSITIYGLDLGLSQYNEGVKLGLAYQPNFNSILRVYDGVYDNGDLFFDIGERWPFPLPGFKYGWDFDPEYGCRLWVTAWVERPFDPGGQWFWLVNREDPITYLESYGHNPGGGFGFGTDPIPWSEAQGVPADMAMTVEAYPCCGPGCFDPVPEPGTILALGSGVASMGLAYMGRAGLALRRKRPGTARPRE